MLITQSFVMKNKRIYINVISNTS